MSHFSPNFFCLILFDRRSVCRSQVFWAVARYIYFCLWKGRGLFVMQAAFLRKIIISANNLRKFILKMIFVWNWLLLSCRLAMASKFSGSFSKKPKPADFGIRHEKPHFIPVKQI
jgi:uncharacterized membrane protein